mgnify:CR=1 FL=1
MKKLWLLVETQNFSRNNEVAIAREPPTREQLRGMPIRPQLNRPVHDPNLLQVQVQLFNSLVELEERATLLLRQNSASVYMIFEGIGVMELPPTDPICKKFNENGELII